MEAGYLFSIISFTILVFSYGYSVLWWTKPTREKNPLLRLIEVMGIGLAVFSFMAVIFDLFHIPLMLPIYFAIGLVTPVIALVQEIRKPEKGWVLDWEWEETVCAIIVIIAAVALFSVFWKGANAYPYLENDDPWAHSQSVVYVGRLHTYAVDPAVREISTEYSFYLEPYPPNYDVILALMWQQNKDVVWSMRFFNVLMCAMAILFAFLMAKEFLGSTIKGAFVAVTLAALPSFMSHFIWSQTLAMCLFSVALYAFLRSLDDKTWRIPAIIAIGSMLVSQPVVSLIFGIVVLLAVGLIFLQEALTTKKNKKFTERFKLTTAGFIVGALGVALSMLYWGKQFVIYGLRGVLSLHGDVTSDNVSGWVTQAAQPYTWNNLFFPPHSSRIDQAIGWGPVIFTLFLIGLVFIALTWRKTLKPSNDWHYIHLLIWMVMLAVPTFSFLFGLPGIGATRFWGYMAIPFVLLATEGTFILINSIAKEYKLRAIIAAVLLFLIILTCVPAKVAVQTAMWVPGVHWTDPQNEIGGYATMQQTLPRNTRVYSFCDTARRSIGFNMQSEPWNYDQAAFRNKKMNITPEETIAFLLRHNFEYVTLDASCARDNSAEAITTFVQGLSNTGRFRPIHQQNGFLLAKFE